MAFIPFILFVCFVSIVKQTTANDQYNTMIPTVYEHCKREKGDFLLEKAFLNYVSNFIFKIINEFLQLFYLFCVTCYIFYFKDYGRRTSSLYKYL